MSVNTRRDQHVREITRLVADANTIIEDGGTVEMELAAIQRALGMNDLLRLKYGDPGVMVRWADGMWAIGAGVPEGDE